MTVEVLAVKPCEECVEVNKVILKRLFHYVVTYKKNKGDLYEINIDTISGYLAYIGIINLDDLGKMFKNNNICRAYLNELIEGNYFCKTTHKVYLSSSRRGSYKLCRKLGSKGRKELGK